MYQAPTQPLAILNVEQTLIVALGVSVEERSVPQEVKVYIKLFFNNAPLACISDDLDQALNYEIIFNSNLEVSKSKEFKLIEHLCYQLFQTLRSKIDDQIKIWLKVEKIKLPLQWADSASFIYADCMLTGENLC